MSVKENALMFSQFFSYALIGVYYKGQDEEVCVWGV